jgi:hypothetical protein
MDTASSVAQIAQMHQTTRSSQAQQVAPRRPTPTPQTAPPTTAPPTPVPVQAPAAVRPTPRRQPTFRRFR